MKNFIILFFFAFHLSSCAAQKLSSPFFYLKSDAKEKTSENPVLILLHGYGSNEEDLHELGKFLPTKYTLLSPRAPITLGPNSYAWYNLGNNGEQNHNNTPEAARTQLIQFIEYVKANYKTNNIYLGGFSQGGILSYSVGLTRPDLIKAILSLSGKMLDEIKPKIDANKTKSLKILITHGTEDKMIGINEAENAATYLKSLGLNPIYKKYNDGHTINGEMLSDIILFLK